MRRLLFASALLSAGVAAADAGIALNQLGYPPGAAKVAAVPAGEANAFRIVDAASGKVVLQGRLGPDVYSAVNAAAIKAYYYNRASTPLLPQHAGRWARPAGHPDDRVLVHASAASASRPEGSVISAPKGWYDAGDYNKYIVNSGITVYTMLAAYEHYPALFKDGQLDIPESGNGLPDLLDEVLWNLEWMLAMQDPADGGVYHKLTNKGFDGVVMPADAKAERYVVQKSTAATLDFAAVMAQASRVFAPFEKLKPGLSARMLDASRRAWGWAQAHPGVLYEQPPDIHTGGYGDKDLSDEFAWAGTELFVTTGDARYKPDLGKLAIGVPGWPNVNGLAWTTLSHHRARLAPADNAAVTARVSALGDELTASWRSSPYRVGMSARDYEWGSTAVMLNRALMLIQAYRLKPQPDTLAAAQALFDHVLGRNPLGRNPLGRSFVTGYGARPPMHPHHRPSEADGIAEPIPGFLSGGPNPGQQDQKGCKVTYPSKLPALSYLDDFCSYASNEIAINWNAPLVYVSAALQAVTPGAR